MPDVKLSAGIRDGRVLRSCQRGRRCPEHRHLPEAVRWARARGEHRMPWEGSAVAYWYRVIAGHGSGGPGRFLARPDG